VGEVVDVSGGLSLSMGSHRRRTRHRPGNEKARGGPRGEAWLSTEDSRRAFRVRESRVPTLERPEETGAKERAERALGPFL